jgi:hypothetical protein
MLTLWMTPKNAPRLNLSESTCVLKPQGGKM